MKETIRNMIRFVVWYLVYFNIIFLVFAKEVYEDTFFVLILVLYYLVIFIDSILRPISEKETVEELDKYTVLLLLSLLLLPFVMILSYMENKTIISQYVAIWNEPLIALAGMAVILAGGVIIFLSRIQLGRFASGKLVIEEKHELITNGVYHYIRHPIYLGGLVVMLGLAIAFQGFLTAYLYLVLNFFLLKQRMEEEERLLEEEFGEKYSSYMKKTRRLVPFLY